MTTSAMPAPMREQELRQHTNCTLCKKPVGHTGLPLFWRVSVDRFGVDLDAVQRQDGLGAFLRSTRLAQAMGPDEEMAKPMMETVTLTICEACGVWPEMHSICELAERGTPPNNGASP